MSETGTAISAAAAMGTVVVGGTTFLGVPWPVWAGGVSGVAFFMLQTESRSPMHRLALFVPSSIGTVLGANSAIDWLEWSPKVTPLLAFVLGLVIVVISNSWISRAGKRGFLSAAFNWIVDKLIQMRGGK